MCILIIICIRKGHQVYYEKILNQNKKVLSLFLSLVLVISSVSVCFTAFASDGAMVIKEEYVVTVNKSVLQCEKNSQLQKNVYLFIASVDDRYCVVDKYYDAAKLYYFNKNANGSPFTGVYNGYYYKAGSMVRQTQPTTRCTTRSCIWFQKMQRLPYIKRIQKKTAPT